MKKLILTSLILCLFTPVNHAQQREESVKMVKKDKGIVVSLKNEKDVTIYIDGKKYNHEILNIIDADKIELIQVLKGEEAFKTYGVDRVLLIKTKKGNLAVNDQSLKKEGAVELTFRNLNPDSDDEAKDPVIIIDGKKTNQKDLKALSADDIQSIKVLKSEEANKKYDSENGVIIVTTKKKKQDQELKKNRVD